MLFKALLCACMIALVAAQSTSSCGSASFNFYNGYNDTSRLTEMRWDWSETNFGDGTNDAFDSFFYLDVVIDGTRYTSDNYTTQLFAYTCDVGTTENNSSSWASYTYNVTDTVQLTRSFWAPRSAYWIRVIDTLHNHGSSAVEVGFIYYGEYGSDSDTTWEEITTHYWVSYEGNDPDSDPQLSVNAGGLGGLAPVKLGQFAYSIDTSQWSFNFTVPAETERSILTVIGQHNSLEDALDTAHFIHEEPLDVFENVTASTLVNWNLCGASIALADPTTSIFCQTPVTAALTIGVRPFPMTLNGASFTPSGPTFNAPLVDGDNEFAFTRQHPSCAASTVTITVDVPASNLTISVDTSGRLPVATAAGGFGGYSYAWIVKNNDFEQGFGEAATVTATDSKGCTASSQVTLPELPTAAPGTVSGSTQLVASFGLLLLAVLF